MALFLFIYCCFNILYIYRICILYLTYFPEIAIKMCREDTRRNRETDREAVTKEAKEVTLVEKKFKKYVFSFYTRV